MKFTWVLSSCKFYKNTVVYAVRENFCALTKIKKKRFVPQNRIKDKKYKI